MAAALFSVATPPAWRALKGWRARQLAAEATGLIEQQQWGEAAKKLRAAFGLRQDELEAWRANARLLSRMRQAPAIEWWEKILQRGPLSLGDRRDYAAAALSVNELSLAAQQIAQILSQQSVPAPTDLLLVGQLAALRGHNSAALEQAGKVLDDPASTSQDRLGANLLILAATKQDSSEHMEAAARVIAFARDPRDPVSLDALSVLARQLAALSPTDISDRTLSIPTPDLPPGSVSPLEIAERLESHAKARPFHRMLALEMRARAEPTRDDELIARAIQSYGQGDDETVAALGAWLYTRGRFESMLEILPIERAVLSRDLMIERIDSLAALGRFQEARDMLSTEEYPVLPRTFQHMYLAVIRSRLEETTAAANEWTRALERADSVQHLLALAKYAVRYGQPAIAEAAYGRATTKEPGLRAAYMARLRILEMTGPTAKAHEIADNIAELWPDDLATRSHEIYLRLLLDESPDNARRAEEESAPLVSKTPWEGLARSTLALARLRQGKAASALQAFSEADQSLPASEVSWPIYAAVLNANGWKDKAREEAQKLAAAKLLPEERALIAPILSTSQ